MEVKYKFRFSTIKHCATTIEASGIAEYGFCLTSAATEVLYVCINPDSISLIFDVPPPLNSPLVRAVKHEFLLPPNQMRGGGKHRELIEPMLVKIWTEAFI